MKVDIDYVPINISYVDDAVSMVMSAYSKGREQIPYLPEVDINKCFFPLIRNLFNEGSGIAAIHANNVVGFLAGFTVNEFFGRYSGVYCPIYGHGTIDNYRMEIYKSLYKHAAELWVKDSHVTHAITVFPHDRDLVDSLFWQGFGLRCIDAIKQTSTVSVRNSATRINKATSEDAIKLSGIHTQHNVYYRQSPIFMLKKNGDVVHEHYNWHSRENHHEWIAYRNDIPVGIMSVAPTAETFVAAHPSVMNIKGVYIVESERGTGVGTALLREVQEWLLQNDYQLCGVDFETINPLGNNFWMKYFTPYTYSLVRRIDERILT